MKKLEKFIPAILTIVLGVLFLVLKGEVISIAMTILGVVLIVLGVLDLIGKQTVPAVVKIVIGVLILVAGWAFTTAVLYILAALLLIYGILLLYNNIKTKTKGEKLLGTILAYAEPIVCIVIGFFLFFNQGGVVNWVFIIAGILAIIEGILMLFGAFKKEEK